VEADPDTAWREGPVEAQDMGMVRATHRLVAKVGDDLERWSFNTAVAACMEFSNQLQRYRRSAAGGPLASTYDSAVDTLLLMLAPMAPHLSAEAWERRHGPGTLVHTQSWPSFDPELVRAEMVTMVVQVDGKVRDRIEVDPEIDEAQATEMALASAKVRDELGGAQPTRVIARPPRLVNVVR
jgi:leucyl-tRNA synthetase